MAGSILPLAIMLDDEDRKIYEKLEVPKSMVVRYGYMKLVAELPYDGEAKPGCGSKLVVRTSRGIELGEMLTTTCPNSGCSKAVSRKDMLDYIDNSGGKNYPFSKEGKVIRVATVEDLLEQQRLDANKANVIKQTRAVVRELDLKMKLVDVEMLLGGERVIFHYTSEDWVDFRELVRRLAAEFQTRIEMHQVNARDEARIVADYEKCGQHCCCKQFLKVLKPVSMKSAKIQKATLDPTKISGRCGRLMCCLRYEDETYDDLRKRLPKRLTRWMTDDGPGTVVDTQILTQLALIQLDHDMSTAAYPIENITLLSKEEDMKLQEERDARLERESQRRERRDDRKPPARPEPGRGDQRGEQRNEQQRGEPRGDGKNEPQGEVRGEQRGEQRGDGQRGDGQRPPREGQREGQRPERREPRREENRPPEAKRNEPRREEGPRDEARQEPPRKEEPRRPKPGQPLRSEEIESREGPPTKGPEEDREKFDAIEGGDGGNEIEDGGSDGEGGDEESDNSGAQGTQPGQPGEGGEGGRKRKRRRRRRRRGGGGPEGQGPGAPGGPAPTGPPSAG